MPTLEGLKDSSSQASIRSPKLNTLGLGQMWNIEAMAFNMPYANMKSITERLHASDLHNVVHRDVQFIVGVYVHPIIHHIFSVKRRCASESVPFNFQQCRFGSIMAEYALALLENRQA